MINISFIGCGVIGQEHIKAFKSNSRKVILKSVFSRSLKKAKLIAKKYSIKKFTNSLNVVLDDDEIDLYVIAVPVLSTRGIVEKIIKKKKITPNLLVEKPIGYNFNEAKNLNNIIKNKNLCFAGLNRNYYDTTEIAISYLKKNNSKRIIKIFDQQSPIKLKKIYPMKVLKNWHYANSIHIIDYIRLLARGKLVKITNISGKSINNLMKKNSFIKKLVFSSGDEVLYHAEWNKPGPWSIKVSNDNLHLNFKSLENLEVITNDYKKINYKEKNNNFKAGFKKQSTRIIKYISGEKCNQIVSISDAFISMNYLKKIYKI